MPWYLNVMVPVLVHAAHVWEVHGGTGTGMGKETVMDHDLA